MSPLLWRVLFENHKNSTRLFMSLHQFQEVSWAWMYRNILQSIGNLYKMTDRNNKQERLRLLSTVALNSTNDMLRNYFRHEGSNSKFIFL